VFHLIEVESTSEQYRTSARRDFAFQAIGFLPFWFISKN